MNRKCKINISETQQKYFTKGYKETFQKDFLYYCLKCFSKVAHRFGHGVDIVKTHFKKCYCKVLQSFPETFTKTLQKYFPKGYKETIHQDYLYHCLKCFSKVVHRFGHGVDIVKTHFKKCYSRFYQVFPKFLPQTFPKETFLEILRKRFKNLSRKYFFIKLKSKKIFPKPCKIIPRKVTRKPVKRVSCIIA